MCMKDASRSDLAAARHQLADADHGAGAVVHAYEALGRCGGRNHVGRLPVAEDGRGMSVQTDARPSDQRRLGGVHPGPELPPTVRQLAPGHGVADLEWPDSTPDERLDGSPAAHPSPQVGGQDTHVGPLAADDAQRRPGPVELLDQDRVDGHVSGRALDTIARPRVLIGTLPVFVDPYGPQMSDM